MTNLTKKLFAESLKKMLTHRTIDNITVAELVEDVQVSRKTFYYHFQDIYDLAEWTIREEVHGVIEKKVYPDTLEARLRYFFEYMRENRILVINTFFSLDRHTIEQLFSELIRPYLERILECQPAYDTLSQEDQEFTINLLIYGLSGMLLNWVREGMLADPELLIRQISRAAEKLSGSSNPQSIMLKQEEQS